MEWNGKNNKFIQGFRVKNGALTKDGKLITT